MSYLVRLWLWRVDVCGEASAYLERVEAEHHAAAIRAALRSVLGGVTHRVTAHRLVGEKSHGTLRLYTNAQAHAADEPAFVASYQVEEMSQATAADVLDRIARQGEGADA